MSENTSSDLKDLQNILNDPNSEEELIEIEDSIDNILNDVEEADHDENGHDLNPDNTEWHIPPDPPKDVFVAEFKRSGEEIVQQVEEEDQLKRIDYRSIRGNLPPQLYNLMSWMPLSANYPISIVPTADDITLATMDAFCEAFRKIDPIHLDHIEIEGRLGIMLNKNTRILPQCASETILFNDSNSPGFLYKRFAAEVFPKDLETMMHYLKQQTERNLKYIGERIISDDIYKGYRIRKYEKITKQGKAIVEEITKKHALMTLDVFNPRYKYDYRIQINIEEPLTRVPEYDNMSMQRRTKRHQCQHFNIGYDFSEIEQTVIQPQGNDHRNLFSAEIEALNPKDTFYKHFMAKEAGNPSRILELTSGFIGHLRELTQLFPNESYQSASDGKMHAQQK